MTRVENVSVYLRTEFAGLPRFCLCGLLLAFFSILLLNSAHAQSDPISIDIQGTLIASEGQVSTFSVSVPDRPIREDSKLYSPRVRAPYEDPKKGLAPGIRYYTATGYTPLELIWDFGDGSPPVKIQERTSASHIYADNGEYQLTVTAIDQSGPFASETQRVRVMNRDPEDLTITATVLDIGSHLVELAGTAMDAAGDSMNFHWDFGDGQNAEGDEAGFRTVQHRYSRAGKYEVTLTISDDDYPWSSEGSADWQDGQLKKTYSLVVPGADDATSPEHEAADPESDEVPLHGRLIAETGGALQTRFDGRLKSFSGLYLGQVESGACRFMFTAWDDANLAHAMAVIDLFNVPPEGGRYRVKEPQFALTFEENIENYRRVSKSHLGAFGGASIPGLSMVNRALQMVEDPEGDGSVDVSALKEDSGNIATAENSENTVIGTPVVEKSVGFATRSGEVVLDFIPGKYAVGYFDVTMTSSDRPYKDQPMTVRAEIALDLNAAASDGIVRYKGCEGVPFEITQKWPGDNTSHMPVPRPRINVEFNDRVDPASLTEDNIQLLYTNGGGALVQVPARILRDDRQVFLVPEKALFPGVEYLMQVKVGDDGLRSRSGKPLPDDDDSGWYQWRFDTALDLVPETDGKQLLACHIFQPARDAPLVAGKPAVARIYANWEAVAGVDASTQTTDVRAVVKLIDSKREELGSVDMTFVRPDRIESRNVDKRRAAHTAQIPFTPTSDMKKRLFVDVMISPEPGREPRRRYRARCPLDIWPREPELSVDFIALEFDEWAENPGQLQALLPALQSIADDAVEYAMQQMPFHKITAAPVRIVKPQVDIPPLIPQDSNPTVKCASTCILAGISEAEKSRLFFDFEWAGIEDWLSDESRITTKGIADMIVVFGPHDRLQGGATTRKLGDGQGIMMVLAGSSTEHYARYVNGAVHEMGHALDLQHIPYVENQADRTKVLNLREPCPLIDKDCKPFRYEAIEAMRISTDGQTWWNKSSSEGNEQSDILFPLMFPGSIDQNKAFIANHQYRSIQLYLEKINFR